MEKFSKSTRFCLICNYVTKIIPALQSRCTRFKFKQIDFKDAQPRIMEICAAESINITPEAVKSVFQLSEGDMRRVVNMLQSLWMANQSVQEAVITQKLVYDFTGNPPPSIINEIMDFLLTENCKSCFDKLKILQSSYGLSLQTLVKELYNLVVTRMMQKQQKAFIVQRLADIQYRASKGCDERIQLASLVGAFVECRIVKPV